MRRAEGVKRLLNSRRSALRQGQRRLLSDQCVKGPGSTSFQLNLRVSSLLEVDPTGFGGCVAFSISSPRNHQTEHLPGFEEAIRARLDHQPSPFAKAQFRKPSVPLL